MGERFKKRSDKSTVKTSVACEETVEHSFEADSHNTRHNADNVQQTSVSNSDGSQRRTVAAGRVYHQYRRRRVVQTAVSEHGTVMSRLGIASNLL